MNALIEQEKREARECRVPWVEDPFPRLTQAVERQIQVLSEKQPQGAENTQIGRLEAVVAKVKASKAPKAPKKAPTQGPQGPGAPHKMKGGLGIFLEEQARRA